MFPKQPHRPGRHRQGDPILIYAKYVMRALASIATLQLLTSCSSGSSSSNATSSQGTGSSTSSSTGALQITMSVASFPAFNPAITDYVLTPPSAVPLVVSVNAPQGTQVSVDGQPFRSLSFTAPVHIAAGQSFPIVVNASGSSNTYYVRGLPSDFPGWTTERPGTPQTEYFAIAPDIALVTTGPPKHYLIIADGYGVPIWWYRSSDEPRNAILLADGDIAFTTSTGAEEHRFDGTLVRSFGVTGLSGGTLDLHELQQLPNGDFVIMADVTRAPVNLSAEGGNPAGAIIDNVIQEIAPNGSLVWQWSTMDHIPVTEADAIWWGQNIANLPLADPYHMNSIEPNGNGFIVSFRHLDAVYQIDKASGNIVWKLGGTHRPESLNLVGDTYGNFGGQHDARILPDGTLTVHDNGTNRGRGPRAARYSINTTTNTATFMEQVSDPTVTSSLCCGSARKGSGGDWTITWGLTSIVTEMTPAGKSVFRMTFNDPYFTYRAEPIPFGVLSPTTLRNGMNAQFPR